MKTNWEQLSRQLGVLQADGSEFYQGFHSSNALEEILGDEWLQHAVDTFIEGAPGNELAIKTLRFISSPKAAKMAYKVYSDNKDTDQQKASLAVWALSDIRTTLSMDYAEEIIERPEYEGIAISVLRNLIFDHMHLFTEQRLNNVLDKVSPKYLEDIEPLKSFVKTEFEKLHREQPKSAVKDLTDSFSIAALELLTGTITKGAEADMYNIVLLIATFILDQEPVDTSLRFDHIALPEPLETYVGQTVSFPVNPEEGYIDGSMYLRSAHNPVDISAIRFVAIKEDVIIVELTMDFVFDFEGIGFNNERLVKEVNLIVQK
jgi:hypothetical protein